MRCVALVVRAKFNIPLEHNVTVAVAFISDFEVRIPRANRLAVAVLLIPDAVSRRRAICKVDSALANIEYVARRHCVVREQDIATGRVRHAVELEHAIRDLSLARSHAKPTLCRQVGDDDFTFVLVGKAAYRRLAADNDLGCSFDVKLACVSSIRNMEFRIGRKHRATVGGCRSRPRIVFGICEVILAEHAARPVDGRACLYRAARRRVCAASKGHMEVVPVFEIVRFLLDLDIARKIDLCVYRVRHRSGEVRYRNYANEIMVVGYRHRCAAISECYGRRSERVADRERRGGCAPDGGIGTGLRHDAALPI